jgi:DNA-binding MarR family transcriptional regulator
MARKRVDKRARGGRAAPDQTAAAVLRRLRRIVLALRARSLEVEGQAGMSGVELWALREVAACHGGVPLGELARLLALHKANATRIVDRLEGKGLVARAQSALDGRVVVALATAAGKQAARRPTSPATKDLLSRLEALPPRDLRAVDRALIRVEGLLAAGEPDCLPVEGKGVDAKHNGKRHAAPRRHN